MDNATEKTKYPVGSMTIRREAMEGMVEAGKAMIKAHESRGPLPFPAKYNELARQVQEFLDWKATQVFTVTAQTPEELF